MARAMTSSTTRRAVSTWDPALIRKAIADSFRKLDPRVQWKNPVLFVTEVVSAFTLYVFVRDAATGGGDLVFTGLLSGWLWITVLFANFAEAMAEGRGKAQAAALRRTKTETVAHLLGADGGATRDVPASQLRRGDVVEVAAGETIPGDGEVIDGIASVDESAITGESAPVIRESGGDRSAVTGGTRVLSDRIRVRVTQEPGHSFLDRMIVLVEGAARQKTPNEIALHIILVGLTIIFLLATATLLPFAHHVAPQAPIRRLARSFWPQFRSPTWH